MACKVKPETASWNNMQDGDIRVQKLWENTECPWAGRTKGRNVVSHSENNPWKHDVERGVAPRDEMSLRNFSSSLTQSLIIN